MLGASAQVPQYSREELPRVPRFADHVVESTADRGAALLRSGGVRCHRDEHSLPEMRFGAQPCGQHGSGLHTLEHDDYHFEERDHVVGGPLTCLDDVETNPFKCEGVRRLVRADVDDKH